MKILDVCCGGKMFYFDKNNPLVEFCDIRKEDITLCDGRVYSVQPDTVCSFTDLPHEDQSFDMVIFDPPHLTRGGDTSWIVKKYGKLDKDYKTQLTKAFSECFRVLKSKGTLIFKWNESQVFVSEILRCTEYVPLIGHRTGKHNKTHWIIFVKAENLCES